MEYDTLRQTMIDSQLRTWDVLDSRVLDAVTTVKREFFVPTPLRHLAFADFGIPLPHGEQMWTPKMEGRVLQELAIGRGDRILEIGTGSGYLTALLATLGGMVHSVEDRPELLRQAEGRLQLQGLQNLHLHHGDGLQGWQDHAPYDVIVYTGSVFQLPTGVLEQLNAGGRLLVIMGKSPLMRVRIITRNPQGLISQSDLFETDIPALRQANTRPPFQF